VTQRAAVGRRDQRGPAFWATAANGGQTHASARPPGGEQPRAKIPPRNPPPGGKGGIFPLAGGKIRHGELGPGGGLGLTRLRPGQGGIRTGFEIGAGKAHRQGTVHPTQRAANANRRAKGPVTRRSRTARGRITFRWPVRPGLQNRIYLRPNAPAVQTKWGDFKGCTIPPGGAPQAELLRGLERSNKGAGQNPPRGRSAATLRAHRLERRLFLGQKKTASTSTNQPTGTRGQPTQPNREKKNPPPPGQPSTKSVPPEVGDREDGCSP